MLLLEILGTLTTKSMLKVLSTILVLSAPISKIKSTDMSSQMVTVSFFLPKDVFLTQVVLPDIPALLCHVHSLTKFLLKLNSGKIDQLTNTRMVTFIFFQSTSTKKQQCFTCPLSMLNLQFLIRVKLTILTCRLKDLLRNKSIDIDLSLKQ